MHCSRCLAATLLALPMLAPIGCNPAADPVEVPDLETPQYGESEGTDEIPIDAPEADNPALADPGQPPSEEGVPSSSGATVDIEDEPGEFILSPPRDLENQPPADAPPAEEGSDSPDAQDAPPTSDEPQEPGVG